MIDAMSVSAGPDLHGDTMTSWPRVSFVMIAYNQRLYIQEAIAAALAQDYPNLQIVLSDDNSTDDTYALMEAAVAGYTGPHTVVLNRSPGGAGILAHFLHALRHVDGDLMVGAAGDDISLPHRVRTLVEHWQGDRPAAIYSAWNRVTADGCFLSRDGIAGQHDRDLEAYFPDRTVRAAFGCTTAYSVAFLRSVPPPGRPIWSEDYFLSLVAMLTGDTIAYVDEPLVSYRQNPQALRNFAATKLDYQAYEARDSRFFDGLAAMLTSLLEMVDRGNPPAGTRVDRDAIVRDIAWYRYRADWSHRTLAQRLHYTAGLRGEQRLRWALPRLIGIDAFLCLKNAAFPLRRMPAGKAA